MRYRTLGETELEVSEISLGSWLTYAGGISYDQTAACTREAYELGINFFDTANVYGGGAAESAWGQILSDYERSSYVLATKAYFPASAEDSGLSRAQIHKQVDASLERLRTGYIDLFQCHRFDTEVPIEETMEALTEVVAAGKVRYVGFSEWTTEQIEAGLGVPGAVSFVSSQPKYSMLWRSPEAELFDLCRPHGITHIVFSPLAQGLLTGKYLPGRALPADSRAASAAMNGWLELRPDDPVLSAIQRLVPIAADAGLTMVQLALAWVLRRPEVSSAIVGASRPEQLRRNAEATGVTLSPDVLDAIDEALAGHIVTEAVLSGGARPGVLHR